MGYPIGGNYWNDWLVPDSNFDGFVDNPYLISAGSNQDNWPFTTLWGWDLAGRWPFDEGTGTETNDTSGDNDGTLQGDTAWIDGVSLHALEFDGAGDYVSIPDSDEWDFGGEDFTIGMWIISYDMSKWPQYFYSQWDAGWDGVLLHIEGHHGKLVFEAGNGGGWTVNLVVDDTAGVVTENVWHYVTVTRSGNDWYLYVDGELEDSQHIDFTISDKSSDLFIGTSSWDPVHDGIDGSIDEVSIYPRALSRDEIQYLYNLYPSARWPLDEGTGTVAHDLFGDNDGALQNGPAWVEGVRGSALNFDGVDDYLELNSAVLQGQDQFSFEIWIKTSHTTHYQTIYSEDHRTDGQNPSTDVIQLMDDSFGNGRIWMKSTSSPEMKAIWDAEVRDGKWHHLVITYDGTHAELFVDGISKGQKSFTTPWTTGNNGWIGMRSPGTHSDYFVGSIDEVSIYHRTLTSEEIYFNYLMEVPVADAGGPYSGDEGSPITFDASGSWDPKYDILEYRWDFNNDGIWDTGWLTDPTTTHTYGDDYSGLVVLEVTDGALTDTDSADVTISNVAPTVEAGANQTVEYSDSVYFSGSFTDPGWLDTHTITWDFGDGEYEYDTLTPSHIYDIPGVYTVILTVEDDDGGVGIDTMVVTVIKEETTLTYIGDTSGQYSDTITVSAQLAELDSEVGDLSGKTITFTIGIQSTSAITGAAGFAQSTITLDQPSGSYTVETVFAGDAWYLGSSDSDAFTIDQEVTTLTYTGDTSGQYSDTITVSAQLAEIDAEVGDLSGKTITFTIGTQSTSAITDAAGFAQATITLDQPSGVYTVETVFAGDAWYLDSSDSDPFTIDKEVTILTYTGDTSGQYSDSVTVSAQLAEIDAEVGDLSGKTITFTIGTQSTSAITDAAGFAQSTITLDQPSGTYTVETIFAGDARYLGSSDSDAFTIDKEVTILTYTGDISGQYSDSITVSAQLAELDAEVGDLSGKTISFTIGTQTTTAITDAAGFAQSTITLDQPSGAYTVESVFAGDAWYLGSSDSDDFTIDKEDTTLTYTGDLIGQYSDTITVSVQLAEIDAEVGDLSGKTISFTIGTQ
ncbi:MAG: LamG-like jellyroll fold domain-containing protein, partial [Candidatus Thorarchaeota archaeon]